MSELILGIDTSTRVCVGLARDGEILVSRMVGDSRSHAELVQPTIRGVLAEAGVSPAHLTGIAIGMGPGPFTGLRVGIAAGAIMAEVLRIPLTRVCSLDIVGLHYVESASAAREPFVAATDARRKEVYWATYDMYGHRTDGPFVSSPLSLPELLVVGPGVTAYNLAKGETDIVEESKQDGEGIILDAGFLAAHTDKFADVGPEPLYLRHADATPNVTVKAALTPTERAA